MHSSARLSCTIFAFATPSHANKAERFKYSIHQHGFRPHSSGELGDIRFQTLVGPQSPIRWRAIVATVPAVDRSVGGDVDALEYSKPALIGYILRREREPVLYCDADLVVNRLPDGDFESLLRSEVDVSLYNHPSIAQVSAEGNPCQQFAVSGVAQLYRYSAPSLELLDAWFGALRTLRSLRLDIDDDEALTAVVNRRSLPTLRDGSLQSRTVRIGELNALLVGGDAALSHPDHFTLRPEFYPLELLVASDDEGKTCSKLLGDARVRASRAWLGWS